jgi:hypothetical protein
VAVVPSGLGITRLKIIIIIIIIIIKVTKLNIKIKIKYTKVSLLRLMELLFKTGRKMKF